MNIRVISFTENGATLSIKLKKLLFANSYNVDVFFAGNKVLDKSLEERLSFISLNDFVSKYFMSNEILVFIGACGIAVRSISSFVKDKTKDPAVIVIDEKGTFVIPILSGHIGLANEYAKKISYLLQSIPVITTATDVNNLFAVDVCALKSNCVVPDNKKIKDFSARLLREKKAYLYIPNEMNSCVTITEPIPKELILCNKFYNDSDLIFAVSPFIMNSTLLQLIPKSVVVGIGCRKNIEPKLLKSFVLQVLLKNNLLKESISAISSIDIKKDEKAILELADFFSVPFEFFSSEELSNVKGDFSSSAFVKKITGVDNICERAVFASGSQKLLLKKVCHDGMTVAIGIKKTIINFS